MTEQPQFSSFDRLLEEAKRESSAAPAYPATGALCYLATPYSKYATGLEGAFIDASRIAARLMMAGVKVYSPIVHTHPLAVYGGIDPLDHEVWTLFDQAMMDVAHVLIVAHMPGWRDSKGVLHEIDYFKRAGKPIFHLDPETMVMRKEKPA